MSFLLSKDSAVRVRCTPGAALGRLAGADVRFSMPPCLGQACPCWRRRRPSGAKHLQAPDPSAGSPVPDSGHRLPQVMSATPVCRTVSVTEVSHEAETSICRNCAMISYRERLFHWNIQIILDATTRSPNPITSMSADQRPA